MKTHSTTFADPHMGLPPVGKAGAAAAAGGALDDPTTIGLARFGDMAKIKPQHAAKVAPAPTRRTPKAQNATGPNRPHEDEGPLQALAVALLGELSGDGDDDDGAAAQRRLADQYDPLQQHTLLSRVKDLLAQPDGAHVDHAAVANKLGPMLARLESQHGAAIDAGRRHSEAFDGALASIAAAHHEAGGPSLQQLRLLYGAKGKGRHDEPLTPAALFESLLGRGGAATLGSAMAALRKDMSGGLQVRGRSGPRLWLSLSDASSFNQVQTSFELAGALRRDLSEHAGVTPHADQSTTAMLLLKVAEGETDKAASLVAHIVGPQPISPTQQVGALQQIRGVVKQLPDALWPPHEAQAQRQHLLGRLQQMIVALHPELPASAPPADTLEQNLRQQHQSIRSKL